MNKGISVLIFAAGAAIGSLVTWKLTKTKYEAIANEEIKSVKEAWAKRNSKNDISKESETDETDDEEDDSGQSSHFRRDSPLFFFFLNKSGKCFNLACSRKKAAASGEGCDDEVIKRKGEGEKKSGEDARHDLRNDDLVKSLIRRTA